MTEVSSRPDGSGPDPTPRRKRGKARYWIAAVLCVGAVGALLFGALGSNIEYYRTVTEAVHHKGTDSFRIAGQVVTGSEVDVEGGVRFRLTDGPTTVTVIHRGEEPGLFAEARKNHESIPIVAQGRWSKDQRVFDSDLIMIKHSNDYEPPSVSTTTVVPKSK